MAETPRAGTGDFACRSWRYWCSTMLNRLDNLSIVGTVLISSLPPPDNRVTQPTHAQYSLFSRLFPSFSNWWVHLDTVSRQIFGDIQETQCSQKWTAQIFCMRRAAPWCRCICEICACICDCWCCFNCNCWLILWLTGISKGIFADVVSNRCSQESFRSLFGNIRFAVQNNIFCCRMCYLDGCTQQTFSVMDAQGRDKY